MLLKSSSVELQCPLAWIATKPGPEEFIRVADAVVARCSRQEETLLGFKYGYRILRVGLQIFPSSFPLLHVMASFGSMLDEDEPISLLRQSWEFRKDHPSLFFLYYFFHENPENLSQQQLLELMIENVPRWDKPYALLARERAMEGDFKSAIALSNEALKIHESPGTSPHRSFFLGAQDRVTVTKLREEALCKLKQTSTVP